MSQKQKVSLTSLYAWIYKAFATTLKLAVACLLIIACIAIPASVGYAYGPTLLGPLFASDRGDYEWRQGFPAKYDQNGNLRRESFTSEADGKIIGRFVGSGAGICVGLLASFYLGCWLKENSF